MKALKLEILRHSLSLRSFSRRSLLWVTRRVMMSSRRIAKKIGRKSNVSQRAVEPMKSGRSFKRRKRLVSRIWLDKVLAGETEVEI